VDENALPTETDPLSAALMKMKLRAFINLTLDAGGSWAIDFAGVEGFTLNVIRKGECWLAVKGDRRKVHLQAGDCFLMTGGRAFCASRDPSPVKRERAEDLFRKARDGVVTCQGGGDVLVVGTVFRFEGHLPKIVFGRLPPVIHIAGDSDQAAVLRWSLDRFSAELRGAGMGRSLMLNHLAPIMLLQTLRIYLQTARNEETWLSALSDPRLSKALGAMHSACERAWSLAELAELATMSRSGFALAFKKKVGVAPMDYLANWRMQVACELLQSDSASLSAVASAVGYASESAFSVAFNKIVKCRPGAYRKRHDAGLGAGDGEARDQHRGASAAR
jgi:AraC-like DNA-binding protein